MNPKEVPEISVLVVGFNSASMLEKCFAAIERSIAGHSAEVLFINNGSDHSEAIIRARFPKVCIFQSQGNIGFAAANNYLAQHALGRYLLLINPDTEIDVDAVGLLLGAVHDEPLYDILGGTTLLAGEPNQEMPVLSLPSTYRLFREIWTRRSTNHRAGNAPMPVEATSGGFMLVRRELWQQLGGMDERFFLYAEDLDLCKRAAETGAKIGEMPSAKIRHDVGSGAFYSRTRQLYQAKGNATYQWKHSHVPFAIANIGLIWLRFFIRALGAAMLAPVSKRHRKIFKALAPLALMPWRWVFGYAQR